MATVIGGIGISHTPSMGIEYDRGTASPDGFSPRWQPWYDGTRRVEELLERLAPDHLVVAYNDHLNHFDLDNYPTLAIGVGARFRQADEGWGPRDLPDLEGDTRWGLHLTEELVGREFDLTVSQDLASFPGDDRVLVIATGGMSHQISGARFGMANEDLDRYFLRNLPEHLDELALVMAEPGALPGTDHGTDPGTDPGAGPGTDHATATEASS